MKSITSVAADAEPGSPPAPPPPPTGGGDGGARPPPATDGPISLWLLGGGLALGLLFAILAVVALYCLCGRRRPQEPEQEPLVFREYNKTA